MVNLNTLAATGFDTAYLYDYNIIRERLKYD